MKNKLLKSLTNHNMDKRGDIIIEEHLNWIIAAVLLFVLLGFLISIPFSKWISFFPDYSYNQNDTYIGDISPDYKLPDGQVRYCPGKIGDILSSKINPFASPTQYVSFWNSNTKEHSIGTSLYLKGSSEEGTIYFKEVRDIAIADVVNGAVLLRPEIFDSTSKERYMIWFYFLSNKPRSSRIEFLARLTSLDKSIIYSGNYICHPDNWRIPIYNDLWPGQDVIFISSGEKNAKGKYVIDLSPYFDVKKEGFEYFYLQNDQGILDFNDNKISFQGYYLTIYSKKLGWFGVDIFGDDKPVGIILRDGSVLINPQIFSDVDSNLFDPYASIGRDSIVNQLSLNYPRIESNSYTLRYFYKTNIFISESKVSELFENVN